MGALNSLATLGLNVAMAQQSEQKAKTDAKAEDKELEAERARKAGELVADATEQKRGLDRSLSRRLAEERARAGAAGVSTTGGSIDAVLRGLTDEADASQAVADGTLQRRLSGLDAGLQRQQRKNLLDHDGRWLEAGARALSGLGSRRRSLLD